MRILVVNAGSRRVKLRVVESGEAEAVLAADLGPPDDGLGPQLGEFRPATPRTPAGIPGSRT